MIYVRLSCGHYCWVSFLSAREGVEVSCPWRVGEVGKGERRGAHLHHVAWKSNIAEVFHGHQFVAPWRKPAVSQLAATEGAS